jgi:hypothetical protein
MPEIELDRLDDAAGMRDDTEDGPVMLLLFVESTLAVVGAVWLLGTADDWWLLAIALTVHLGMTVLVLFAVFAVVSGRRPLARAQVRRPAVPRPPRVQASHRPVPTP